MACFFENQCTKSQLIQTKKPVRDLLITVYTAWSASMLALIVNPIPLVYGIFTGNASTPSACPNSINVQSYFSNFVSPITGLLGSKTISVLWYFLRCTNILSTWSMCTCISITIISPFHIKYNTTPSSHFFTKSCCGCCYRIIRRIENLCRLE